MAAGTTPQEISAALTIDPETLDYFDHTDAPYLADVLAAIRARRNVIVVPTPGVPFRTQADVRDPSLLDDPNNFMFLDAQGGAFVLASAKKDLQSPGSSGEQRVLALLPDKLRQLRQLGLPMTLGSDAGSPLHFQAGAIWWELEGVARWASRIVRPSPPQPRLALAFFACTTWVDWRPALARTSWSTAVAKDGVLTL